MQQLSSNGRLADDPSSDPRRVATLERRHGNPPMEIMGQYFDPLDEAGTVESVFAAVADGCGGWLIPSNLDVLRQIRTSSEVRALVADASLVVADGMPLVWAAAVAGRPLPARVAGSTLLYSLSEEASRRQASVFFLGGDPGTASGTAEILSSLYPGLIVAGTYCPPFGFESDQIEMLRIIETVRIARPDLVFVGLGFPKQERLVSMLRKAAPTSYFIGVGISFSFVTGDVARAPSWLQRLGMEWVHRLVQEPRRLFKRYIIDDVPFAVWLLAWAASVRLRSLAGS